VCATDPGFKHTTTPNRYLVRTTNSFHLFRLRVSAHAAKLQVDNAARAQFNCVSSVLGRAHRFIEAYRRSNPLLKFGVIEHVRVSQRLLDQLKTAKRWRP